MTRRGQWPSWMEILSGCVESINTRLCEADIIHCKPVLLKMGWQYLIINAFMPRKMIDTMITRYARTSFSDVGTLEIQKQMFDELRRVFECSGTRKILKYSLYIVIQMYAPLYTVKNGQLKLESRSMCYTYREAEIMALIARIERGCVLKLLEQRHALKLSSRSSMLGSTDRSLTDIAFIEQNYQLTIVEEDGEIKLCARNRAMSAGYGLF
jgi:hypothetical protein